MRQTHGTRVLASPISGVSATYSEGGQRFARHWHDSYSFGLLDRGGQRWRGARGRVDARPGQVIDTNPGEVHDGEPFGADTRRWRIMSVDVDVMARLTDSSAQPEIVSPAIDDVRLAAALRLVFSRIEGWSRDRTLLAALGFEESLVASCVFMLSRHGSSPWPGTAGDTPAAGRARSVSIVRDRLADDPLNTPTLGDLAAMAGLSRYQLLRAFKRQFGLPPLAWLLCRRAERARALITSGMRLAEAAAASGFTDQSHMTRTFVRFYGYTPGVLRGAAKGS